MPITFGASDYLTNLTRGVMDDKEYMSLLAKTNTALYLMMKDPVVQQGSHLVANVVYKRKKARVTNTGAAPFQRTVNPPHITGREQFVRVQLEYGIDGFEFKLQSGVDLEDAVNGNFTRKGMRTLVNAHKNEFISAQDDFSRDLNKYIINGGTVDNDNNGATSDTITGQYGGSKFIGLRNLAFDAAPAWGGLAASSLGDHEFDGFTAGEKQKQWAPVTKAYAAPAAATPTADEITAATLSIGGSGDLFKLMSILNHGGSQIRPSSAFDAKYVGLISQNMRGMIIDAFGDKLRRNIGEGGGASTDVTGFRRPIVFEEFNLELYPDTDMPDGEILVWNPACVRLGCIDRDMKYVKKWALSTSNNTCVVPFRKEAQLYCNDLSQIGGITGILAVSA